MTIQSTHTGSGRGARKAPNPYTELSHIITSGGWMRRRYGYYWTKLVAAVAVLAASLAAFVLIGDTWWQLFTAAGFAIVFTQIAMLGHDAAHRQIFISGKWNDWTTIVIADLLVGMSYGWWQPKHTRHHANPNKIGSDPDIELPVISVSSDQMDRRRQRGGPFAWVMAHQGLFFFPILLLEGLSLHASSVRRVFSPEPLRHRPAEIAFLIARLGGFVTLVFFVLSPGIAAVFLAVQLGLFGVYMGMAFAPNHKGMPLVPADVKLDFLRRQVLMSRNVRGSRFLDVAMGGLNYQIEHHLFPSMPRPHLRDASATIREFCQQAGVRYTETGLWESYAIVTRYINRVGLGERDPFECPLVQQRQAV